MMTDEDDEGPPCADAVCSVCGQVKVSVSRIILYICDYDDSLTHYSFLCPTCSTRVEKYAPPFAVALLMHNGTEVRMYRPAWGLEVKTEGLPDLTEDAIIDLGLFLDHYNTTGEGLKL